MRNFTRFFQNVFSFYCSSEDILNPQPGNPCRQNTRKWIFTWIGTCLTCTCLVFGQSSDCEPGNVLNGAGDHWSEQCYLNSNCEEQGNPCTANDVQMMGIFVANADGNAIPTCENNESVSLYLWGQFDNTTNSNRYAVRTVSELYVNGVFIMEINQCSFDVLAPGESQAILLPEFTFMCGDQVELRNTWVAWDTSPSQCTDPAGDNYDCCCNDYPPSKCSKNFETLSFLIPNFSFECHGRGDDGLNLCISNLCYGGVPPLTFDFDFGDGFVTTDDNPCHTYASDTGEYVLVVIATDANGISASATETIHLEDLDCCVLTYTCPPENAGIFSCSEDIPHADQIVLNITDFCGLLSVTALDSTTGTGCPQDTMFITRTYIIEDQFSQDTCTQIFKVVNGVPPMTFCPANITVSCAENIPGPNTALITSSDNCTGGAVAITVEPDVTVSELCAGSFIVSRTYVATDPCGNTQSCEQSITVLDENPPLIFCPVDITVACADDIPPVELDSIEITENCSGSVTITLSAEITSDSICNNQKTITRIFLAVDECGNSSTCAQVITVNDDIAPQMTCVPDLTVACTADVPLADLASITADDNCTPTPVITVAADVISDSTCINSYTITRVYTAADECGNATTCAQVITVHDPAPPMITCPANLTLNCTEDVPPADISSVVTSENCSGSVTVSVAADEISNLQCEHQYTLTRVYTVLDACGNISTCAQIITVHDESAPLLTCPPDLTVSCGSDIPAADIGLISTTDNCDGTVTVTVAADVTTNFITANNYTVLRTYIATDDCGNSNTCTQVITVHDVTPPVIACLADLTVSCSASVPPAITAEITASDNCGGVAVTVAADVINNQTCTNSYTITRVYIATDDAGNSSTCSQTITVQDSIPPLITCPVNVTVTCATNVPAVNLAAVTATDNCAGTVTIVLLSAITSDSTCVNHKTITRTFRATDICGNSSTCSEVITVNDNMPPAITCPDNITVTCANAVLTPNISSITASDNCSGTPIITVLPDITTNPTCTNQYTLIRTYRATDACGNSSTCTQTVTVFDSIPPTIIAPASVTVSCAANVPAANIGAVTTNDNCNGSVSVIVAADVTINQTCANQYAILRTYIGTDLCGNTATSSQTITVNDTSIPILTCPANVTVSCPANVPAANPDAIVASDSCGGAVTVTIAPDITTNQTCTNRYTITRTYIAADACGNTASCSQIITVFDDTPPVISMLANITVSCVADIPPANVGAVNTVDNCIGSDITVTVAPDVTINQSCANQYTITRTYTAIDACGNAATIMQTITVQDNTSPQIECPADVTVSCAANVPPVNLDAVTATDNCGGSVTIDQVSSVVSDSTCVNHKTITTIFQVTDACGNSSTCSQVITVLDNTPPQLTCPANITVTCASDIPVANPGAISASDNCTGAILVTVAPDVITNQMCENNFIVTRTFTAMDACGNSASCAQIITVLDQTGPVITCPADITLSCTSDVPLPDLGVVSATDNCNGAPTIAVAEDITTNVICTNNYTLLRIYSAMDDCGNMTSCTQTITVHDVTAPAIDCPANVTVSCAADVPAPNPANITATDNCGGVITITVEPDITTNQTCANQYIVTRTYLATDDCGNTATCIQTITVFDNIPPLFTCAVDTTVLCGSVPAPDLSALTATDNCGGAVTISFVSQDSTGTNCPYQIERIYMATDICGNTSTCLQNIFVLDTVSLPGIINIEVPDTLIVQCYGQDSTWQVPELDPHDITIEGGCSLPMITHTNSVTASDSCEADGYIAIYERIYTATDSCGNSDSDTLILVLIDTIPPVIHGVPDDITVSADSIPTSPDSIYATDECLCACVMVTEESGLDTGCLDKKVITRTWSATDQCGNHSTAIQHITVIDEHGPSMVLDLPGLHVGNGDTLLFSCEQGGIPDDILQLNIHSMSYHDPSGPVHLYFNKDSTQNVNCELWGFLEEQVFTWEATDACDNTADFSFTVRLNDHQPPVIHAVPDTACINDPLLDLVEAIDSCSSRVTLRFFDIAFANPCGDGVAFRRTYEAVDGCGNFALDTVILIPDDSLPPLLYFTNPKLIGMHEGDTLQIECDTNLNNYTSMSPLDVASADNCPGLVNVTFSESLIAPGNCQNDKTVATVKLNWLGTDECGNNTTLSLIGVVKDHTAPSLVNYDTIINVGCTELIKDMEVQDNCGSATISNQDVTVAGPCPYKYDIKRIITATDECGNSATFPQLIHVGDDNGPVINGIVTEVCNDLTMPLVTAFDSCAGVQTSVTMVQDTLSDTCRDGLVITRQWTSIDLCGDTTSVLQYIIMGDSTPPLIIIPNNSILQQMIGGDTIPVVYMSQSNMMNALNALGGFSVMVVDDCDQEIDPLFLATFTPSLHPQQDGFTEQRQYFWIATDVCGNADTIQFIVNIVDDIPPLVGLPGDTAVYCSPLPPPPSMIPADTSENVTVNYQQTITAGAHPGEFSVLRTWTITDNSGNVSTVIQHITWVPDTFLECDIVPPPVVICNSHDVVVGSHITGGVGPFTYYWVVIGEACFIQTGQNTPEISIYVGWAPITVILYVTDAYGCTTSCETTITCQASDTGFAVNGYAGENMAESQDALVNIWPNPSRGAVDLRFTMPQKQQVTITLVNYLGETVLKKTIESEKGINESHLDLNSLPNGPYFMDFQSQDIHSFRKIMLLNDK